MASITNIPPNRIVALLTPTVFAPLAGAIAVAAAEYAPGTNIDETSLTAIFIAGSTIAFGKAAQWTKGWQQFEQHDADVALAAPAGADFDDELADGAEHDEDLDLDIEHETGAGFDALEFLEEDESIEDELMALSAAHEE